MASERKKFFDVEIPSVGTKVKLLSYNIEELNNRTIKLDLTRVLRGKSLEAVIKVIVKDGKAEGEIQKIVLLPFFIRRMMRKSVSYVEDSFSLECATASLRIKPFLITRKKVTRAVRKALRDACKLYLEDYSKDLDTESIFGDILDNRLQKSLSVKLKKIYPLALCEIRDIKIEKMKEGIELEKIKEAKAKSRREQMLEKLEEEKEGKSQIEEIEEALAIKEKVEEEKEAEK